MNNYVAIYDGIGEKFDQAISKASEREVEVNTFFHMLGDVNNKRVLDLACGHGFFARQMIERGADEVVGVDISSEMIKLAINDSLDVPNLQYHVHDVALMPHLGSFDLVSAVWLLCYADSEETLVQMLVNIHNSLLPGGRLIAYTSNPDFRLGICNFTRYGLTILSEEPIEGGFSCDAQFVTEPPVPFHFYRLSREVYERAIRRAGFSHFEWVVPMIPQKHLDEFGEAYWYDFQRNCDQVGLVCQK
ncbi:class I SAM-dependent methyltransferase [Pseudomonas sp. AL03]|uniref:class I SAM-dependent DNA methyltransferase n=1 Tax=Pseudomonas sp. AL03 TaxID=3042230 RepID=UPI00249AF13D|nr:class I SAM-dependent methyltransferase [Pseudomonas sp. AL03]MDI3272747.1 class I SAM-dependent methyltransferase [Pseudomonas sp. AL03]